MRFGLIIVWELSSQRPFLDLFRLAVDTKTSISSYLVNLDDRSIWNWNPKLINRFSNAELSLRISNFPSSQGEDQLAWRCYKPGTFKVHSYYDTLRWFTGAQFPLWSQWGAKLLCTIAFFFWTGLGLDCGCRQSLEQHLVLIDWCCMCKVMTQLSIFTTLFSGTRFLAFCVYIIQDCLGYAEDLCLRYCSVGRKINYHIHSKIWKAIPLFVLWTLWAPQSCYQEILLRSLYEWMTSLGCIPSSSFLEFINLLNLTL